MSQIFKRIRIMLVPVGLALLGFSGCAHRNPVEQVPVEAPAAFSGSGSAIVPDEWWTVFNNRELDAVVATALEGNFDLAEAWERLREARAVADRESASFWPTLDAEAGGRLRRPEFQDGDQLQLGLSAAYEVDLWGRIRSSLQAQRYRAEATSADFQAAALSLSAEVTRTWLRLLNARGQERLLRGQAESNQQSLDLLRQNQLLESTRGQLLDAEARVRVLQNQLAILLGKPPGHEAAVSTDTFPTLPPLPDTGIPADLVQRRPDARAAFNRLAAADREVASAVASRWPRLSLSASVFTEDNNAVDLFDDWIRSLAANLVAPVIDGGRRRAEVERADAVRMQRLFAYSQTILEAFREVEDALVLERKQAQRLDSLGEQSRLARESLEQLRRQYVNGVGNYLDVLTAQVEEQRLERERLSAELDLYEFRIALYRALAGSLGHQGPNPLS